MKYIYSLSLLLMLTCKISLGQFGTCSAEAHKHPGTESPPNGTGSLGQIYNTTACGLNYTQASKRLGQRFVLATASSCDPTAGAAQPATFNIAGIPASCRTILKAYLWCTTSGSGVAINASVRNPLGTTMVFPMAIIGTGTDKCWGQLGSYNYRADVTAIISGNGGYQISGFPTDASDGSDDVDGATLFIIYRDLSATYQGTLVINDGCIVQAPGLATQVIGGFNSCANSSSATALMIVSDLQCVPGGGNTETANGSPTVIAEDWWNFVGQATTVTAGQSTSSFSINSTGSGDCYDFLMAGLYYQTMGCTVCTPFLVATSFTPTTCGNNDGTATATPNGGTGPYTYSWNTAPVQTSQTAVGLAPGNYTVIVTDANGCTVTQNVNVPPSVGLAPTLANTPVSCNGGNNGTASITVTGGSGVYTYSWNTVPVQTSQTATGLAAGTYAVTVSDGAGCNTVQNIVVTAPALLTVSTAPASVLCNGGNTGTATANPLGGTAGYTYSWNTVPVQNTAVATGLTAGTYTVTVHDANGCVATQSVVITQPAVVTAAISASTNVSCNGGANGTATAAGGGGTPGYTYTWNTVPVQNTATANGLAAGTYTVTVHDLNGCTAPQNVVITQPTVLNAGISASTNVSCNGGANGSATVTAGGGTAGYTYSWNTVPVQNTATANGLAAGNYTVTVTDANGCANPQNVVITQPALLTAAIPASTNVSCNGGANGTATALAGGGTGAYTYSWNTVPVQNTAIATGLAAGNYTVTIHDANGCVANQNIAITQPTLVTAVTATVAATCSGNANGSASVTAGGGTGAYTYSWNTVPVQNTQTANALLSGTYTVTVTDANGCTATQTAVVTQPSTLASGITASANVSCNGGANGSATVTAGGGAGGYTYSWNSVPVQNTATANGLPAGSYTVTITDVNGCAVNSSVVITQPTVLNAGISASTNVSCNGGANGSATVTAGGGTAGYTYSWNTVPVQNTATANGLAAGNYTVTVTDANGCANPQNVVITQPTLLTAAIPASTNVSCNAGANGTATALAGGGTGAYTYSWNTVPVQNTAIATGLAAGNYTVTIHDANGCVANQNIAITQPTLVTAVTATVAATCSGNANGSASVTANGGTGAYSYSWNTVPVQNTQTANALLSGTYTVTVTDANGCTATQTAVVTQPSTLASGITASANVSCNGGANGSATVTAGGGAGGYTYSWNSVPVQNTATANGLAAGSYTVTITDVNGCAVNSSVVITEPALLTSGITASSDVTCNGASNGSATVTAGGGTSGYTYLWAPSGGNAATANNLSGNNYTVTITDAHGCITVSNVVIAEPAVLTAGITASTNVSCNAGTNGSAGVSAGGGTAPYAYLWSPSGGNAATANNMAAGNYSVTVTDAHGCTNIQNVVITQPAPVTLSLNSPPVICYGQSSNISANGNGGVLPYTFLWSNGSTAASQSVSPLVTTTYSVVLTDANGCSPAAQTLTVNVHPQLSVSANSTPAICNGAAAGISANGSGGNGGPYSYSWNGGVITTANATVHPAVTTTYTVTVSDGCSPSVQTSVTVVVNPNPIVNFTPHTIEGCTPVMVDFADSSVTPAGSSYLWTLGDGTTSTDVSFSHAYTDPGQYTVSLTIVTAQGCTASLTQQHVVTVDPLPVANFTPSPDVVTILSPTIDFTDQSTGAATWSWNFGDGSGTDTIQNPSYMYHDTGTYTIQLIVKTDKGCLDTIYATIRVNEDFAIYIPNAFTPNGDITNDGFIAQGFGFKDYDMTILNRWGGIIYHSQSKDKPWDGTYFDNGTLCQNDVYIYKIRVHDSFGKLHEFIGHVSLIR